MSSTHEVAGKIFHILTKQKFNDWTVEAFTTPPDNDLLSSEPFTEQTSSGRTALATIKVTLQNPIAARSRNGPGACQILFQFSTPPLQSPIMSCYIVASLLGAIEEPCAGRNITHLWSILTKDSWIEHMVRVLGFLPCSCLGAWESADIREGQVRLCKNLDSSRAKLIEMLLVDVEEPSLMDLDEPSTSMGLGGDVTEGVERPLSNGHREPEQGRVNDNEHLEIEKLRSARALFKSQYKDLSQLFQYPTLADVLPVADRTDQLSPSGIKNQPRFPRHPRHQSIDNSSIITTPQRDILAQPIPLTHSDFPSLIPPVIPKKFYCTHFLRTGTCAYAVKGCRYSHALPTPARLSALGFDVIPKWYREREMEMKLAKLECTRLLTTNSSKFVNGDNGDGEDLDETVGEKPTGANADVDLILSTLDIYSESPSPSKIKDHSGSQDDPLPIQEKRVLYCIHWLRTGQCDFTSQPGGCRYLHVMPDVETLYVLGFKEGMPKWWLREQTGVAAKSPSSSATKQNCGDTFLNGIHADIHDTTIPEPSLATFNITDRINTIKTAIKSITAVVPAPPEPLQTKPLTPSPTPPLSPSSPRTQKTYCTYYLRSGHCSFSTQGQKCKFSHDLPPVGLGNEKQRVVVRLPPATTVLPSIPEMLGSEDMIEEDRGADVVAGEKEINGDAVVANLTEEWGVSTTSTTMVNTNISGVIASTPPTPTRTTNTNSSTPTRLPPILPTPPSSKSPPLKKKYCTHFLMTGECDFIQQGCRFLHSLPGDEGMEDIRKEMVTKLDTEMGRDVLGRKA